MVRLRWFIWFAVGSARCAAPSPNRIPEVNLRPAVVPAPARVEPAAPASGVAEPVASDPGAAASAPAPAATVWPGVECADSAAAPNLRFFACTAACDRGEALGCETLGDLRASEEGTALPTSSAGPAARAWRRACGLGDNEGCAKETELMARLDRNCRVDVAACVTQGNALLELEGDAQRPQVDALYQRACRKGHALGCFQSAELHGQWEPRAEHEPLSRKAYLRACQLGAAEGCCAALSNFEAEGNLRAAARVRRDMSKIWGAGCGNGGPILPQPPQPLLALSVEQLTGSALAAEALQSHEAIGHRLLRYCHATTSREAPKAPRQHVFDVEIDAQGKVSRVTAVPAATGKGPANKSADNTELVACWTTRIAATAFEASQAPYALRFALSVKPRAAAPLEHSD